MADYIPCLNTLQVDMIFTEAGQRLENVYHVHSEEAWTLAGMTAMAEAFKAWWITNWQASVAPGTVLAEIIVTDLTAQNSPGVSYSDGLPAAGTATGQAELPNNVTCVVSWSTGLRGRSYRGRTYHIGLTEEGISGSNLTSGARSVIQANYAALITAVSLADGILCIVSRMHNKAPRTAGVMTTITNCAVDSVLDSQRRRLPGRGN